jgi:PAS domain S-box-containing protein
MNQRLQGYITTGLNTDLQSKLENAIQQSMDGIALLDANGNYYYLNQRHVDIFGYTKDEMLGQSWQMIYDHTEIRRLLTQAFPELHKNGSWKGQTRGKHKDGFPVMQEISLTLVDGGELICICRDISELLEKESIIAIQKQRLDLALNASGSCYWEWSVAEERIVYSPGFWTRHMGYAKEGVADKVSDTLRLVHPDDRSSLLKCLFQVSETSQNEYRCEYRMLKGNGEYGNFIENGRVTERNASGKALRVTGMLIDISEQKRLEQKAREDAERYQLVLEHTGSVVWEWQLQTGIVKAERNFFNLFGLNTQQDNTIPLQILEEGVHPEDWENMKPLLSTFASGTNATLDIDYRFFNQHEAAYKWYNFRGRVTEYDNSGIPLIARGLSVCIAGKKELEDKLLESQSTLRMAMEASASHIWEWNPKKGIIRTSSQLNKLLGYDQSSLEIKDLQNIIVKEDLQKLRSALKKYLRNEVNFYEAEIRISHIKGHIFWVYCRAQLINNTLEPDNRRLIGIVIDITALKEARNALKAKEEKWQHALKASGAGFWEMDIETNRLIISFHQDAVLGFPPGQHMDTSIAYWRERIHPTDLPTVLNKMLAVYHHPGSILECEFRVKNAFGHYVWLEARGVAIRNEDNRVIRMMGFCYGISYKMNILHELADAKKEAEQLVKNKRRFLSHVSHEIRTPMHAILNITESLLESGSVGFSFDKIKTIHQSAVSLTRIVNDVLDLSRLEEKRLSLASDVFSPAETVRSAFEMLYEMAMRKGLTYRLQMALSDTRLFIGDSSRLRQILVNILGNAIKFTPEGFVYLLVKLGRTKGGTAMMKIQCRDSGIGIDRNMKNKVLSEFTQEDSRFERVYGGSGLGLTITNELVKLMDGRLEIKSRKNQGTTLYIEIPLPEAPAGTKVHQEDSTSKDLEFLQGLKLLAVEDNDINRTLLDEILKKYPISYQLAESGAEAVSLCRNNHFDVILMDIQMPELNGIDATREIRKLNSNPWIVAMTAHAVKEELEHYLSSGMNDYITKPFREADLLAVFRKSIAAKNRELSWPE